MSAFILDWKEKKNKKMGKTSNNSEAINHQIHPDKCTDSSKTKMTAFKIEHLVNKGGGSSIFLILCVQL